MYWCRDLWYDTGWKCFLSKTFHIRQQHPINIQALEIPRYVTVFVTFPVNFSGMVVAIKLQFFIVIISHFLGGNELYDLPKSDLVEEILKLRGTISDLTKEVTNLNIDS